LKEYTIFRQSIALAPLLVAALFSPFAYAAEKTPADLVVVQQGNLPIILTVPHGGREEIPSIAPRNLEGKSKGGKWNGFVARSDTNTDVLAQRMAARIKEVTGKDVYLVMAKFQRKFVDANRKWRSIIPEPVPITTSTTPRSAASLTKSAEIIRPAF
jgi:N-formylglutamate amidohydrolase